MSRISRRELARYGTDQLLAGKSLKKTASELVAALADSDKLNEAEFLVHDIAWELERRQELSVAQVVSARELSVGLREELAAHIKTITGSKEVVIDNQIDESLIGGLKIETASRAWDMSIRKKLTLLKEAF